MIQPYKFISQTNNSIYNDCLEASLRNLIETYWGKVYSIMDIQNAMQRWGLQDTAEDGQRASGKLGYELIRTWGDWDILKRQLDFDKPIIALVRYQDLPYNYIPYKGGHFVTIIGMTNTTVTYVDTLYLTLQAATKTINRSIFGAAWTPREILYPKETYQPPAPPVPPIIEDLEMTKEEYAEVEGAKIRAELLLKGEVLRFWKYENKATVYVGKPEDKTKPIPSALVFQVLGGNWDEVKVV